MEYFIGLTFDPSSVHYHAIKSFRERFDSKYALNNQLQLTILPPFSVEFKNRQEEKNFIEELTELLEGHLHGLTEISQIEFNGMTFGMGKKGSLSLTPIISPDILYCQESLYFFLKEYGVKFQKTKSDLKPLLPIGRFDQTTMIESAIDKAKLEFSSPFVMEALSVVLFEKTPRQWSDKFNLYDFDLRNHNLIKYEMYA